MAEPSRRAQLPADGRGRRRRGARLIQAGSLARRDLAEAEAERLGALLAPSGVGGGSGRAMGGPARRAGRPDGAPARAGAGPARRRIPTRPSSASPPPGRASAPFSSRGRTAPGRSRRPWSCRRQTARLLPVNDSRYRGNVLLVATSRGTLHVVNRVGLEEYLLGVVPLEMGPRVYDELEALKAQAVAARTYAVKRRGDFSAEGYDLCATARCQVSAAPRPSSRSRARR